MSLLSDFSHAFDDGVIERGRQYAAQGRVRFTYADANAIEAEVTGSDVYSVLVERELDVLYVACGCPYVESNQMPCKHIGAVIAFAEARGEQAVRTKGISALHLDLLDDDFVPDSYHTYVERAAPTPPPADVWRSVLGSVAQTASSVRSSPARKVEERQILYIVDVPYSLNAGFTVEIAIQRRKKNGEWSVPRAQRLERADMLNLPDPEDRAILASLAGGQPPLGYGYYGDPSGGANVRYILKNPLLELLLPRMCATGRTCVRTSDGATPFSIAWDDGGAWEFRMRLDRSKDGTRYTLQGILERNGTHRSLTEPVIFFADGVVIDRDVAARLEHHDAFQWIVALRRTPSVDVSAGDLEEFLKMVYATAHVPPIDLPRDVRFERVTPAPVPILRVRRVEPSWARDPERFQGELAFDYDGIEVAENDGRGQLLDFDRRRILQRNLEVEEAARVRLDETGFRIAQTYRGVHRELTATKRFPGIAAGLLADGWRVEAEGKLYRSPGKFDIQVQSGIDWFDLEATVDFEGVSATLPDLLAAVKRGEKFVELGDGSVGMLPEEWLKKYGALASVGEREGESLRFTRSQAGLLDALLAAQPEVRVDRVFAKVRRELQRFEGVKPADPPKTFYGDLRPYQREGLGWFRFLDRFGFGGCLADDMGLGKTVQVLALLEEQRVKRVRALGAARRAGSSKNGKPKKGAALEHIPPSLVVVPKSLVYNWRAEAERFAPNLRVCEHVGMGRAKKPEAFEAYDVVLTTYGTLRRDVLLLKEAAWDYVVLDEAQAIKNATTAVAKASRLLGGRRRLALSGTPVENHIGELWSLFEFLNPGLLGNAAAFESITNGGRIDEPETRATLARALRPFILRRTKGQVAKDLPEKHEQTIYCDLEPRQRRFYDQLRDHYRKLLLQKVSEVGIKRAKIHVLEALLRLRQTACHAGLVDKRHAGDESAKLNVLLENLTEVVDEGHKALVFSQFTSLLAILRDRLNKEGIVYEYLDGKTRDRGARVERFQTDPDCRLFLISLKAGGLGLNLTEAEYVYLLDPWWNPAVEAQAIDRTHRIGQTRKVFAYRLIARDTVEEKVLELQKTKRDLAEAIITADSSLIRSLEAEDLELLLS